MCSDLYVGKVRLGDVRCTGHIQDSFTEGKEMGERRTLCLDGLSFRCP